MWKQYAQDKTLEELIPEHYEIKEYIEQDKKDLINTYKEKQDIGGLCHGLAMFYLFDEEKHPTKRFLYQAINLLEQSLHRTLEKQEKNFINSVFLNVFILQEDQYCHVNIENLYDIPSLDIYPSLDLADIDKWRADRDNWWAGASKCESIISVNNFLKNTHLKI